MFILCQIRMLLSFFMKDHAADNLFSLTSSTTINIRIQNIFIAFIKPDVSRDLPDKCIPSFLKSFRALSLTSRRMAVTSKPGVTKLKVRHFT